MSDVQEDYERGQRNHEEKMRRYAREMSDASDRFKATNRREDYDALVAVMDAGCRPADAAIDAERPGLVPEAFHHLAELAVLHAPRAGSGHEYYMSSFCMMYKHLSDRDIGEFLDALHEVEPNSSVLADYYNIAVNGSPELTLNGLEAFFAPIFAADAAKVALVELSEISCFGDDHRRTETFMNGLFASRSMEQVHFNSCDFSREAVKAVWDALVRNSTSSHLFEDIYIFFDNDSDVETISGYLEEAQRANPGNSWVPDFFVETYQG